MSLRSHLRSHLTDAMKSRDKVTVAALRSALAAMDDAEAVEMPPTSMHHPNSPHVAGAAVGLGAAEVERRLLTDADERAVLRTQAHELAAAAQQYQDLGRLDDADRLRSEAAVLLAYLPGDAT